MQHPFSALIALAESVMDSDSPTIADWHRVAANAAAAAISSPSNAAAMHRAEAEAFLSAIGGYCYTVTRPPLSTAELLLTAAIIAARAAGEELGLPADDSRLVLVPHLRAAIDALAQGEENCGNTGESIYAEPLAHLRAAVGEGSKAAAPYAPPPEDEDEGPATVIVDALVLLDCVETAQCYDGATAGFATLDDGRELQFQAAWGGTSAALAALSLVGHPAIVELQRYCADAPAEEVGYGVWNDLEGAFADGERQEQSRAAEKMRAALVALGLPAPAGHAVCSGCGREIGDGHDSDCTAARWFVTLRAEGVQVTARNERHAGLAAESDLSDPGLGPWNVTAEVVEAAEDSEHDEEATNWEVELQGSAPDGSARLWTFTGTCELCIIAETAEAALAEALGLQRAQLVPAAEGEG